MKPETSIKKIFRIEKNRNSLASLFILSILAIFILFIESILILVSFFKKGVMKKKVLTNKSKLGFDIDIYIKE